MRRCKERKEGRSRKARLFLLHVPHLRQIPRDEPMQWGCAWPSRAMWALPAPQSSCTDSGLSLWPGLVANSQVPMISCSWGREAWVSGSEVTMAPCRVCVASSWLKPEFLICWPLGDLYSFAYTLGVQKGTQGLRLGPARVCTMKYCLQRYLYQETFIFVGTAFWSHVALTVFGLEVSGSLNNGGFLRCYDLGFILLPGLLS